MHLKAGYRWSEPSIPAERSSLTILEFSPSERRRTLPVSDATFPYRQRRSWERRACFSELRRHTGPRMCWHGCVLSQHRQSIRTTFPSSSHSNGIRGRGPYRFFWLPCACPQRVPAIPSCEKRTACGLYCNELWRSARHADGVDFPICTGETPPSAISAM